MSTIGATIDRVYRTYLEPPDHQPATCALDGAITAGATTLVLGTFVVPEDEELVREGVFLEVDAELFLVTAYDELTTTCTVVSGQMGTAQAAHADGARVKLSPPFPRQSVFEAVADNIITLYPHLWSVNTSHLASVGNVVPMNDNLAVDVVEVWSAMGSNDLGGRLVDYHPVTGGRSVILDYPVGDVWVKYRRRFGSATSEDDTLVELGVDPRWERIVVIGACADLFVGRDLPNTHVDWVGKTLQAESIPVGTRTSLAGGLQRYREGLIKEARSEMRAEYRSRVRERPLQVVDNGVW